MKIYLFIMEQHVSSCFDEETNTPGSQERHHGNTLQGDNEEVVWIDSPERHILRTFPGAQTTVGPETVPGLGQVTEKIGSGENPKERPKGENSLQSKQRVLDLEKSRMLEYSKRGSGKRVGGCTSCSILESTPPSPESCAASRTQRLDRSSVDPAMVDGNPPTPPTPPFSSRGVPFDSLEPAGGVGLVDSTRHRGRGCHIWLGFDSPEGAPRETRERGFPASPGPVCSVLPLEKYFSMTFSSLSQRDCNADDCPFHFPFPTLVYTARLRSLNQGAQVSPPLGGKPPSKWSSCPPLYLSLGPKGKRGPSPTGFKRWERVCRTSFSPSATLFQSVAKTLAGGAFVYKGKTPNRLPHLAALPKSLGQNPTATPHELLYQGPPKNERPFCQRAENPSFVPSFRVQRIWNPMVQQGTKTLYSKPRQSKTLRLL
ncbi:hypothetical protein GWK47_019726 [Chionoecetes opilio]|uniref:Uncharacterized protein n=1 Tax=Chionoecetes opilio TaxID=41210 RepID=A0A8J4XU96_CHIOP|nr:hypothetical protein GWK47_019726 [Chionoecetes opilio]